MRSQGDRWGLALLGTMLLSAAFLAVRLAEGNYGQWTVLAQLLTTVGATFLFVRAAQSSKK